MLAEIPAYFIFYIPGLILSEIIDFQMYVYMNKAQLFIVLVRFVFAYYGFKYVIKKNLLPYIDK